MRITRSPSTTTLLFTLLILPLQKLVVAEPHVSNLRPRQSFNADQCFEGCLEKGLAATDCLEDDIDCLCTTQAFITAFETCVVNSCSAGVNEENQLLVSLCSTEQVNIGNPGTLGITPSPSTTQASSGGSETSAIAPGGGGGEVSSIAPPESTSAVAAVSSSEQSTAAASGGSGASSTAAVNSAPASSSSNSVNTKTAENSSSSGTSPTTFNTNASPTTSPSSGSSGSGSSQQSQTGNDDTNSTGGSSSSNKGAIIGGVVGGIVGVALISGLIWLFVRERYKRKLAEATAATQPPIGGIWENK